VYFKWGNYADQTGNENLATITERGNGSHEFRCIQLASRLLDWPAA